jgi:hypothetical protein
MEAKSMTASNLNQSPIPWVALDALQWRKRIMLEIAAIRSVTY